MRLNTANIVATSAILIIAACSGGTVEPQVPSTTTDPAEAAALVDSLISVFQTDGLMPIDVDTARCVAAGTVEALGVAELSDAGVTVADPDGPLNNFYSGLDDDQIGWVVSVWSNCADVPELVERALLSSGPEDLDPLVVQCLEAGLSAGLAEAFLAEALTGDAEPGGATADVLRLVDGCSAGAERADMVGVAPGMWPWLTVGLPGYEASLVAAGDLAADELVSVMQGGPGIDLEALEVNTDGGDLAAILVVVAIDQVESGGITPDLYAANIVASAAGAEIHPITLPGGIEVVGWEEPDQELIFLVWIGRRIVVLATGPLAAADVLALYGDLVPAP